MYSNTLFSVLAVLLLLGSSVGAVGTVAASPADVQFQQETPTENNTTNTTENNTTSTPTRAGDFAGPSNDSGDTIVVQVGDSSTSDNSTQNNSSATEPPFDAKNAEHEFNNGILLNEGNHNQTTAVFTLYNPTNASHWVVTNNNDGWIPRIKSYELEPGEAKTLKTPTTGNILQWSVSVTSTDSIKSIETGAQYNIEYSALVINYDPLENGIPISIANGVLIILMFVAVMKFNLRVGKIAIPLAGQSLKGVYQDADLPDRDDSIPKQARDIIHGFGLLAIVGFNWAIGVFAFWDLYPLAWLSKFVSGFGFLFEPATLVTVSEFYSNLMVYWAYDCIIFIVPVYIIGRWYLRRNGVYLHDIAPWMGDLDYAPWLLSPARFADLEVYRKYRKDEDGPLKIAKLDKRRLLEVNHNSQRRSYVCEEYLPKKNICFVTNEDVDPSELARNERWDEKLVQALGYLRPVHERLRKRFKHLVGKEAFRLHAEDTARLEDELVEGGGKVDDWLDQDLEGGEFDDVVGDSEAKDVRQILEDNGLEVQGLTDTESDGDASGQDSQQAGGAV